MAKIDKEFNLRDWEWIAVHFPPPERESMAKVAWFICCKCTPEEIHQYNNLDPRIVIPLCAIVLLDEIDLSHLKISRGDVVYYYITSKTLEQKQKNINLIINSINSTRKWKSLFTTLNIDAQFTLLHSIIIYPPLNRNQWRNIFLDVRPIINVQIEFLSTLCLTLYLTILYLFMVSLLPVMVSFLPILAMMIILIQSISLEELLVTILGLLEFLFYIIFWLLFFVFVMIILLILNLNLNIVLLLAIFVMMIMIILIQIINAQGFLVTIFELFFEELLVTISGLLELLVTIFLLIFIEDKKRLMLLMFIIVTGNMLLHTLYSQLIFSNKITFLILVLILVIMSVICSILLIDAQKKQLKANNPLKDILKSDSYTTNKTL